MDATTPTTKRAPATHPGLGALGLTALGIVFGDVGTSPLYTLKTVIDIAGGHPAADTALGLLSLLVWTLLITTSLKYVTFVMRVDNDGEGGILALMSLLGVKERKRAGIIAIGLFGAALIYGDGVITPSISVLSALEGMEMITPGIKPWVVPGAVAILIALFSFQPRGTATIGHFFGPVMALWFAVIAAMGIYGIAQHPAVLIGLNPYYAIHFLATGGYTGFLVLGGVFLCVTGAEALYADMGHVGARPIRLAWYGLVLPSLLLNYAGQTALLLQGASTDGNIFYRLCPPALLVPLIILATVATIIASQAIITGAFSMTRQAIQLGWMPRMNIKQTSSEGYGQIYIGMVNWSLMIMTLILTISFGSSDSLAAAYGIAVSLTMLLTTSLLFVAMREIWRWPLAACIAVATLFFVIDLGFFAANLLKILEGGWVPLTFAAIIYGLMVVWHRGTVAVYGELQRLTEPAAQFIARIKDDKIQRVPGSAVFLTRTAEVAPPIMVWHVKQNRALHEKLLALTVVTASTPWVAEEQRLTFKKLADGFWQGTAVFGFMETPDLPRLTRIARDYGCHLDHDDVTFYIGHETVRHREDGKGMPAWEELIFAVMERNAAHVTDFFRIPRDRVVEIGRQIEI